MALSSRAKASIARVFASVLCCAASACDPNYIDIISRSDNSDPCAALDAAACAANTADGCAFQPSPTGCSSSDVTCGAGVCASGDPFVRASGEALFLHGKPFTFLGTVSWGLAWSDTCQVSKYPSQAAALGPTFDEFAAMHLSALRVWAFQSSAGDRGNDFSHLDALVNAARATGVRLILVLENMHPDCSSGVTLDDQWFASGYKSPYGKYALSYRDYVTGVVSHFSNEPTIMAWELMHEAGGNDFNALDAFAADMTALIRKLDTHHLIALGTENGTSPATSADGDPSNYFRLQSHPDVDLLDVHDFDLAGQFPAQFARCQQVAHALGKPIFAGATAVNLVDTSASSFELRAEQLDGKLQAAFQANFRGFLVYDYVPGWTTAKFDFDTRPTEPLSGPGGLLDQRAPKY